MEPSAESVFALGPVWTDGALRPETLYFSQREIVAQRWPLRRALSTLLGRLDPKPGASQQGRDGKLGSGTSCRHHRVAYLRSIVLRRGRRTTRLVLVTSTGEQTVYRLGARHPVDATRKALRTLYPRLYAERRG
jgi:hypothetical protein